ncbi:MAG: DUF6678 family protein, partial [Fibrobacteria bacterium]
NRLDARMNGTKWRAAIDAVMAIPGYTPSFRVKIVTDAAEPPAGAWDTAFPDRIPLYNSIEWLELNPAGNPVQGTSDAKLSGGMKRGTDIREAGFRDALRRGLNGVGIPIEETATGIRIIGFSRTVT